MELPFKDIPKECTIIGAFAGIKALDEQGRVSWFTRYDPDIPDQEMIGQMVLMQHQLVQDCMNRFQEDDDAP